MVICARPHGATPEGAYGGLAAEKPGHEVHGAGF